MALNFNKFAAEANTFLKAYAKDIGMEKDHEKAGRILSAILHGLRDLISMEESLQLLAQLPMFLKAVYVNSWNYKEKRARIKTMPEFIDLVRHYGGLTSVHDFESDEVAENYIHSTFLALRQYISDGELEDIRDELSKNLKEMIFFNRMVF